MVKPVELEFRFMVPVVAACSTLARACRGAVDTGSAWRSLPGAAWDIGIAAVSTGGGTAAAWDIGIAAVSTGGGTAAAGSAGRADGCIRPILL
jgi:hypothetical protein